MTETPVAPPPPVPVREKGYAHDSNPGVGFWTDLTRETTPELQWPGSIAVFERMRRQDAQVSSVLRAVTSPILRTGWSIDGTGCDDEITDWTARNLGLPVKGAEPDDHTSGLRGRDRFSFNSHLRSALLKLPFGHSYFEQVYRYGPDGRAWIRKLALRPAASISQVSVARDGGLVSIEQHGPNSTLGALTSGTSTIPVNRLVAYVLEREGGNWLGVSILRSAYKNWLLKDRALRTWSQLIDRQGLGIPWYTAGDGEKDLEPGRKIAQGTRAGDNSGGAGPKGSKLDLIGVTGALPDISVFVKYQDEQIARAVLAHFLNLGTQTGSWALGSTFADFFTLSLQAVADDIRETFNSHVVEDLVDINFGRETPAPQLVFEEIGSRNGVDDELSQLRQLAGLEGDDQLAEFLRQHVTGNPSPQEATA